MNTTPINSQMKPMKHRETISNPIESVDPHHIPMAHSTKSARPSPALQRSDGAVKMKPRSSGKAGKVRNKMPQ